MGNPCVDAVDDFRRKGQETFSEFVTANGLEDKPIIALLAGSRRQEIKDNLTRMIEAARSFPQYQFVVAGAPGIEPDFYKRYIDSSTKIVFGQTYRLLQQAEAALVTSGTATLETALFRVPQVVCYYISAGKLVSFLRRHILKVKYISLVNLIADREVVTELVADGMTVSNIKKELAKIISGGNGRSRMLSEYDRLIGILGEPGASERAAAQITALLKARRKG